MDLKQKLTEVARRYPERLVGEQLQDIDRIAFHVGLIRDRKGSDVSVMDIGGGIGLFSVGCAAAGMKATLVDDFSDQINRELGDSVLDLHRSYGVNVISQDVVRQPFDLEPASFDVITSFDAMEHFHSSPKRLFHSCLQLLRPDGLFLLGVPNCVNLRKRVTVPFGRGKWSRMEDWYEPDVFRGHVREPDIGDLKYIARDLKLRQIEILGRNWLGYYSPNKLKRLATLFVDHLLRVTPSLCGDIYMLGRV